MEGGRGVEAEVEGFAVGEGDGGDVLVLGGVEAAHDADEIDDGADVSAVEAAAADAGVGGLVDEVGAGSVAESFGDGLAVAVVEEGLAAGLGEAVGLGVDGLLEAVAVGLEVEGAGEEVGVFGEGLGVVGRDAAHVGEIGFDAGLFEAGFGEVLRGADEDAGAAADGGAEGAEVAAGFGGEEEDDLLGFGGHGDGDAFFADFFVPGLDLGEPVVGGRVGGAAEEGGDEEVVDGLGGGEVGMQPDLVAGLEVGNLGDGQGTVVAGDVDVDLGAGEVETRGVCVEGGREEEEGSESSGEAKNAEDYCHHSILDGRGWLRVSVWLWTALLLLAAAVDAGRGMIAGDDAVADGDDAVGVLGDVGLVGDDDDGVAAGVEIVEEGHDLVAGLGVEVSGGLVGEDDGGAVDEGAGDGDALALAAGELVGLVHHAGAEVDGLEDGLGAGGALGGGGAVVDEGQLDVVERGGAGEEIEGLEDEADLLVANAGEFVVVELGDVVAVEPVAALRRASRGSR